MSTFEKVVVIDAKGHLLGRLASIVSKQILSGQKVVVVRCEEMNVSGSFFRNKLKYQAHLRKRCIVNPKKGAFHFRAPSRIFYKAVRGMVPHKSPRGAAALSNLKVFEGIPPAYNKTKRMVVPEALRVLRLRPGRKYTTIKRISEEFGWKYSDVVSKLEAKRKEQGKVYHEAKKLAARQKVKAAQMASKELAKVNESLAALGH
ncbi:60S ribosomal protein L16 [Paraphysoderma sedebokerense]|nr:60S ribosomal protein L16 [Paraphysoderma sedebokerense]